MMLRRISMIALVVLLTGVTGCVEKQEPISDVGAGDLPSEVADVQAVASAADESQGEGSQCRARSEHGRSRSRDRIVRGAHISRALVTVREHWSVCLQRSPRSSNRDFHSPCRF